MSDRDQTKDILLEVQVSEEQIKSSSPFLSISCPCCHTDIVFVKRDISHIVVCSLGTCKRLIKIAGFDLIKKAA